MVSPKPSFAGLGHHLQLADLDADGGKQLVSFGTEPRGYFELDDENEWHGLRTFNSMPNIDFGDANTPLKYIDLINSNKPHIMVSYKNNLGKEVAIEYTPSTKFYIEDKLAGKPWVTKLHFPVMAAVNASAK